LWPETGRQIIPVHKPLAPNAPDHAGGFIQDRGHVSNCEPGGPGDVAQAQAGRVLFQRGVDFVQGLVLKINSKLGDLHTCFQVAPFKAKAIVRKQTPYRLANSLKVHPRFFLCLASATIRSVSFARGCFDPTKTCSLPLALQSLILSNCVPR